MDAETQQYIDEKFAQLVRAIGRGLQVNDTEHGHFSDRIASIEKAIRVLDRDGKVQRERIDRLEAALFGKQD
jgi:hypothetical protein